MKRSQKMDGGTRTDATPPGSKSVNRTRPDPCSPPNSLATAARKACRSEGYGLDGYPPRAAALAAASGAVYTGRDTASPVGDGAVVPAERIALYRLVMAGERCLTHLAICAGKTGTADGGPPDGATLQILHEFSPRLRVYWGSAGHPKGCVEVRDLLPGAFTGGDLSSGRKANPRRDRTGKSRPKPGRSKRGCS